MAQVVQKLSYCLYTLQQIPPNKIHVTLNRSALFSSIYRRKPLASSYSASSAKCFGAPSHVESKSSSNSKLVLKNEDAKTRIRKLFDTVDVSAVSTYDTAWVAMVPDPHDSSGPFFPECVDWLVRNQLQDGSWSLPHHSPHLRKDVLSSTLACVLALKKWGIADDQIQKGVGFLEQNFASVWDDELLVSPVGFDIIFPGMLQYARDLGLNLHLDTRTLSDLFHKRDFAIMSLNQSNSKESKEYVAYLSEGMLTSQDWDMAMKFQRKNGSLFNSPSATAAAAIHLQNSDCINYLRSIVEKFGPSVPAVYPLEMYPRLCLVDNLERLGISRHFKKEIQNVLDDTYRFWQRADEEIFAEASTCAIAFRLLRNHGYDISADPLAKFVSEDCLESSFGTYWRNTRTMLELYRASELIIHQNEIALEKNCVRSKQFLHDQISNGFDFMRFNSQLHNEVENILKLPSHANLERVANKRFIEQFDLDNTRVCKTSYCSSYFSNQDLLSLAIQDFNDCQALHREELNQIQRWVREIRFCDLKFFKDPSAYCYFSAAATNLFSLELSDARLVLAKSSILASAIDDLFDSGGSIEELKELIEMVEKWDVRVSNSCSSEPVKILFSALYSTVTDIGYKAFKWQERDVTGHIVEIWLDFLYAQLKEAEWGGNSSIRITLHEYMQNSIVSFALGPIILPTMYLIGPKLLEGVAKGPEVLSLYKSMSTCGRLLNDIQGFERESKEGTFNYLSLRLGRVEGGDHGITKEDVITEMKDLIDKNRRDLLRLVLHEKRSLVPKACKDLFWNTSQVLHQFYYKDDGYRLEGFHKLVNSIIHEPIFPEC